MVLFHNQLFAFVDVDALLLRLAFQLTAVEAIPTLVGFLSF